jgi:hypothetical protein
MDRETNRIAIGDYFKVNELGALRCPNLADKTGIVVGLSRRTTGITVLFDGDKTPTCLYGGYISSTYERR